MKFIKQTLANQPLPFLEQSYNSLMRIGAQCKTAYTFLASSKLSLSNKQLWASHLASLSQEEFKAEHESVQLIYESARITLSHCIPRAVKIMDNVKGWLITSERGSFAHSVDCNNLLVVQALTDKISYKIHTIYKEALAEDILRGEGEDALRVRFAVLLGEESAKQRLYGHYPYTRELAVEPEYDHSDADMRELYNLCCEIYPMMDKLGWARCYVKESRKMLNEPQFRERMASPRTVDKTELEINQGTLRLEYASNQLFAQATLNEAAQLRSRIDWKVQEMAEQMRHLLGAPSLSLYWKGRINNLLQANASSNHLSTCQQSCAECLVDPADGSSLQALHHRFDQCCLFSPSVDLSAI